MSISDGNQQKMEQQVHVCRQLRNRSILFLLRRSFVAYHQSDPEREVWQHHLVHDRSSLDQVSFGIDLILLP